ncbi:MAG TPA: AIR synthase related protein [Chitinophagales bacterium]|nr:AIR synthase related protein [Chitinophagales bacterium]
MDKYEKRGVSAGKEEVHDAVKNLNHGLYPKAFCKIYPDYLGGEEAFCNVMSSDGSGTKSILAYLYWKETGDISVWRGIAIDALVMNLDDLLCIGATENFLYTSIINRNKHLITGAVIAEIIKGGKEFIDRMAGFGTNITLMGGETADLGDCVRTATVDASMTVRMRQEKLVLTQNIQPGNVIIGLASYGQATYEDSYNSGISSNGLTSARHDLLSKYYALKFPETFDPETDNEVIYTGSKRLTDKLEGTPLSIGQALLSPTRTFLPVVKKVLHEIPGKINGIINNTGGAQTKVLHYINNLRIIKDNLLPVPPIFKLIQQESETSWKEMFKVLNCGTRMELYTNEKYTSVIIDIAKSYGIAAQVIGYVEAADEAEVLIKHETGEFNYR